MEYQTNFDTESETYHIPPLIGGFQISGLPPGKVKLSANHPEYTPLEVDDIPVEEDKTTEDVLLTLSKGTLVHGWVKDVNGRKKDNIALNCSSRGFSATTQTDDQGEFSFPHVSKGNASIYVRYIETAVRFKVTGEEEKEINIDFSQAGSISGKIHLPSELENAIFNISFRSCDEEQQNQRSTYTGVGSNYSFRKEGLLPGKYKLALHGFRRVDGSTVRLNLTTSPAEIIVEISPKQKVTRDITVLEITDPE